MVCRLKGEKGGDSMTDTKALKEIINESGYKMEFLAEKLGITRGAFSMKVNNITDFKVPEMYALCDLLNINKSKAKEIFFLSEK